MTVAVAVTLVIAVAGGCRWIWIRQASRLRLLVHGCATWIPDQFSVPARPGVRGEEMTVYEIVVRNAGESDAVIEAWGVVAAMVPSCTRRRVPGNRRPSWRPRRPEVSMPGPLWL
jgi:hypothetical protein